jgi:photosystem II stability/assembly factor-like uncharacterized protein
MSMVARLLVLALLSAVLALAWVTGSAPATARPALDVDATAWDADSWFTLTRAYPSGRVPPAHTLERAARRAPGRELPRTALQLPDDRWVSIGPAPIFVRNRLPYAGRVTTVAPHPTNAGAIFIGTDGGGIWRTTDGGQTWRSLTESLAVPAIASLAVDRANPRLIYATTIPRTYAIRLLRSTDGGASWTESPIVTDRGDLSPVRCSVNVFKACIPPSSGRIFLDPQRSGSPNASTLYFTASSHLFRSDDSGRTFRRILTLDTDLDFAGAEAPNLNPDVEFLRDAVVDPVRPNRLVAAVARPQCLDEPCTQATTTVAIYRSFDAGEHWSRQQIGTLAPYPLVNTRYADPGAVYVPRVRLAIAPSNPDVLAIAFRDETLNRPRVYRSVDGGDVWTETAPAARSLTWPLALAFSPTDANTMYVGSSGVHRTVDGGANWLNLPSTHVDNIDLQFTAAGTLVVGNDGGIYRATADGGFTALHQALPITEFYSIAAHPTNGLVLAGGTQDNGTVIFQGSLGWSLLTGGDGGDVVFDPDPQARIVYAEVEWFQVRSGNVFQFYRCQSTGCVERSVGIDTRLDGPFIPRVAMDPQSSSTLWLTAERLFRTDDRAENWAAASPSVGAAERCWQESGAGRSCARARYFTAIAIAPSDPQTVYAGTLNGDVWMTTDRGATWQSRAGIDAGPLPVRAVNDIVVDPLDSRTAYVAYSGFDANGTGRGHVFRTTDGGSSWADITGTLPDLPVNTLLIDPDSATPSTPRVIYAGTDIGVFRVTLSGSLVWQPFGAGLPPVVVNRLAYNPTTRQLLAATYGRGVWAISSRFSR